MSNGYWPHPSAASAEQTPPQPAPRPPRSPRRGAILVVEDRDDVRQGLSQLLELHGYLVADASSGEKALQHLETDQDGFALVLLDLMLPGRISGSELRTHQLANPVLAAIPTIVVTASELDARERGLLQPAALLEKPFRFDDLLVLVRRYVVSERGSPQAE